MSKIENDYDEEQESKLPSAEEVLMNEDDMLRGLLEAANFKNDKGNYKKIQVVRNKKLLFEFRIRPLEEEEIHDCRKRATKYIKNPAGKNLPKVEGDTDYCLYRSFKIYTATIEEDKPKIWDNPKLKSQLGALTPTDIIDQILLAGEKDWICDVIDELSGYGDISREEYAKN